MHLQLDLVDEARAVAEQRLARYQNLMSKHYNSKVRHKDFQIGDLVLRKVMGAAKDPSQGKLGPRRWMDGSFNTHGTQSTFGNTTSKDDGRRLPLISQPI